MRTHKKHACAVITAVTAALSLCISCSGGVNPISPSLTDESVSFPDHAVAFGFTPFPYAYTAEAVSNVQYVMSNSTTIYAFHLDNPVPWEECYRGTAFPAWKQNEWNTMKSSVPAGRDVYLALIPAKTDRRTIAYPVGPDASTPGVYPPEFAGPETNLNNPYVKWAYLQYAVRAVNHFGPRYLNLGIEMSLLSLTHSNEWTNFADLYIYTYTNLKALFPQLQIGFSCGLQDLMNARVAAQVKPLVEMSDYLGISFYPYASSYGEHYGSPPLGPPPGQWLNPLAWLRTFTTRPVAICETGYTTKNVSVSGSGYAFNFSGNGQLQRDYLHDLFAIAIRDGYKFIINFEAADYDRLNIPANDFSLTWQNVGVFDSNMTPKPAWSTVTNFTAHFKTN
ncbi:MAG: hypothetical protein HZC28_04985 [Spirochaetes bacterium]|nr:hypothetical protein [Spirochaetota bacterium]